MGKMEIYKTTRVLHMWIKNNRNECIYIYAYVYEHIYHYIYIYTLPAHALQVVYSHWSPSQSECATTVRIFTQLNGPGDAIYAQSQTGASKFSAQNPPKHKEPIERPLDKGSLSFMSRNMDLFHLSCVPSACLHVALHVQSWYHNENRWNSLYNRKM